MIRDLTKNPNRSHVIRFNGESVTCFDHTDESVIELANRYYEKQYNFKVEIENRASAIIYRTE